MKCTLNIIELGCYKLGQDQQSKVRTHPRQQQPTIGSELGNPSLSSRQSGLNSTSEHNIIFTIFSQSDTEMFFQTGRLEKKAQYKALPSHIGLVFFPF